MKILMIYVTPGCEHWCSLNGKNIPEQEAGRIQWEMVKAGATRTVDILPHGEVQVYVELKG